MYHLFIPWILLALSILLGLLTMGIVISWGICLLKVSHKGSGRVNRPSWALLSAVILFIVIVALNCSEEVFSLGALSKGLTGKSEGEQAFKVLSYNVHAGSPAFSAERLRELIESEEPDYVFLAETGWALGVGDTMESLPYRVFTCTGDWTGSIHRHIGNVDIPSARATLVSYPNLRLFCCHLASNNTFKNEDGSVFYMTPDSLSDINSLKYYLENYSSVSEVRHEQVHNICDSLKVGIPTIIMGDMNDLGGSETLRHLKKAGFRDAWWTGGLGYGATYHEPLPFRIDHIYYSPELRLHDIRILRSADWGTESVPLSDHDALVATFSFRLPSK